MYDILLGGYFVITSHIVNVRITNWFRFIVIHYFEQPRRPHQPRRHQQPENEVLRQAEGFSRTPGRLLISSSRLIIITIFLSFGTHVYILINLVGGGHTRGDTQ